MICWALHFYFHHALQQYHTFDCMCRAKHLDTTYQANPNPTLIGTTLKNGLLFRFILGNLADDERV
jgi:hypothetical protein